MLLQLQQLQQEVMLLNGKVEEQANELRRLKEQSLERYVDLDKRVSSMSGGAAPAASVPGGTGSAGAAPVGSGAGNSDVAEQPGEGEAYRAAYALVRGQQFDEAVPAFKQFLQNYPSGRYAPNAHYWLGELYLVIQPPDPESARQSFKLLIDQYPDNTKVPDALYKLGRVHFMKGNRDRAREYLDRVISQYGSSDSSAAKLAQDFIDQNY
jgi:tol-pal system protein YbgF